MDYRSEKKFRYIYQDSNRYFAQLPEDVLDMGVSELSEFNAENIERDRRGIYFTASKEDLYRINYKARLFSRFLAPLIRFNCPDDKALYRIAKIIPWAELISSYDTFAIFANVSDSEISHSRYASQKLKDAVVDTIRDKTGSRPDVDPLDPDIWINLHIRKDKAVISIATSGGALHRRGYRKESVPAPIQETLAAAIIRMSGWNGEKPLYDPMCGSGTLLSEALMHYCNVPSAYLRNQFGFEYLPDYNRDLWQELKSVENKKIRTLPKGLIAGSDISVKAISAARTNMRELPEGRNIKLKVQDFNKIKSINDSVIVCNPPYGIRLGKDDDMNEFYKSFGDFLKQKCTNSTAYIYFGERELLKSIGLKPKWKKPFKNGGLDGRLTKFELY